METLALDDAVKVGPVTNLLHNLFSQVDVSLNGTLITNCTNTYPYRAHSGKLAELWAGCQGVAVDFENVLQGRSREI